MTMPYSANLARITESNKLLNKAKYLITKDICCVGLKYIVISLITKLGLNELYISTFINTNIIHCKFHPTSS